MKVKIKNKNPILKFEDIVVGEHPLTVEIAKTDKERNKGLSARNEINDGTGMLFLFPQEDFHSFWMRDTRVPLMVYWLDKMDSIVDSSELLPYDLSSKTPSQKALKAIEVPLNWAKNHPISFGDKVKFKNKTLCKENFKNKFKKNIFESDSLKKRQLLKFFIDLSKMYVNDLRNIKFDSEKMLDDAISRFKMSANDMLDFLEVELAGQIDQNLYDNAVSALRNRIMRDEKEFFVRDDKPVSDDEDLKRAVAAKKHLSILDYNT